MGCWTDYHGAVPAPPILETARLRLRPFVAADADFIIAMFNDPDYIHFVGDRDVRDRDGAIRWFETRALVSYENSPFGPWAVEPREGGEVLGMCGLWQRDGLDAPDLGYAFLPAGRGQGFAREAAAAGLAWARTDLGISRVLAITTDEHVRSQRVLESIGMVFERHIRLEGDPELLRLYASR